MAPNEKHPPMTLGNMRELGVHPQFDRVIR